MLGVLSMIFWSLFIVIVLKYIVLILRSDNAGEGGILSLLALVQQKLGTTSAWAIRFASLAALGTALFYCDGMITPAISVLSAVEGLELLNPKFEQAILPVTLLIIAALFVLQKRGTARVGGLFGPIMVIWFVTLGVLGVVAIVREPDVLAALFPGYALALLAQHPAVALPILGAVFLTLTGGEALYADMGHFGRRPVRLAWFALVWPALAAELLRSRRVDARGADRALEPVLRARAELRAAAARDSRDGRDDHRVAGDDLGRVLADSPGRAARPAAARADPANVAGRARTDLRAGREPVPVPRRRRLRARVPLLRRAHRPRTARP